MTNDLSTVWADFGWWLMPDGRRRLLSWNAATHELKFWSLNRQEEEEDKKERRLVVAVIHHEDEVRRLLDGWSDHNDTREGLAWLAQRLEGCR